VQSSSRVSGAPDSGLDAKYQFNLEIHMKKSLLALAVLGAFAGAASAQSSVTLYGLVDTYVEWDRVGNPVGNTITNTKLSAGGLSGPRWGLRGSEDLGGGNNAIFVLEGGYNSDTGTLGQGGRLFGRQGFVGFNGQWGTFVAGRQYAPIFYTQADSDTDGFSTFSQPAHLANINGNTLRQDNQIRYESPALGTFKGMVSYAPGENPSNAAGGTTAGRIVGANFTLGAGPVNIVGGYHRENATAAAVATLNTKTIYALGANSKFGDFSPVFNYFSQKTDNVVATDTTIKGWSFGSGYALGPWAFQLQYGQVKNDAPIPSGPSAGQSNSTAKEKFLLLGGDYIFSKRTNLYLRYVEVKDSNTSGFATNSADSYLGVADLASAKKNSVIALGVRHRF
jgi:predicted porin